MISDFLGLFLTHLPTHIRFFTQFRALFEPELALLVGLQVLSSKEEEGGRETF